MTHTVGEWLIDVPWDIDFYQPPRGGEGELIAYSELGQMFRREATIGEKCQLIEAITGGQQLCATTTS